MKDRQDVVIELPAREAWLVREGLIGRLDALQAETVKLIEETPERKANETKMREIATAIDRIDKAL